MALTSCGLGRLSRVALRHWGDPEQPQQRYFTFALLGGSTIQVPESTGLSWLVAVERWLGALVMPPKPAEDEKAVNTARVSTFSTTLRVIRWFGGGGTIGC